MAGAGLLRVCAVGLGIGSHSERRNTQAAPANRRLPRANHRSVKRPEMILDTTQRRPSACAASIADLPREKYACASSG